VSQSSLVGTSVGDDARRSTRIERSVPLIVFGQNRLGEPFVERTVSTSINMHGCRYPSRHNYGVGAWVTLQVVGLNVEPKPPAIRARVRSVHSSQSSRELQQVGVELEKPGNVWGILAPPDDWLAVGGVAAPVAQFATAAAAAPAPTREVERDTEPEPEKFEEPPPLKAEPKLAEVATFPSPPSVAPMPPAPKPVEVPKPQRVVITPDGLISALQGRLQRAAEQAVQAAVAKQVDEALRRALDAIDDVRQSSVREVEELFPARIEALRRPAKEEFTGDVAAHSLHLKEKMEKSRLQAEEMTEGLEKQAAELRGELARSQEFAERMTREIEPQIHARLNEAMNRASAEFDGAAARAADRRYERLLENAQALTQEALLKLEARSAEFQALLQGAVNTAFTTFQRQSEQYLDSILAETRERAVSALSSLDAESRAACDARRQAIQGEVARAAERSTEQFRKGMKAFLYSCLVAAVSAVDEHSKSTLEGLLKDNGKSLQEASGDVNDPDEPQITPGTDKDSFTH